jgi:hypothetical protein
MRTCKLTAQLCGSNYLLNKIILLVIKNSPKKHFMISSDKFTAYTPRRNYVLNKMILLVIKSLVKYSNGTISNKAGRVGTITTHFITHQSSWNYL